MHQHPALRGVVARGEVHLTGLLMIAPYLGGPHHAEVIERTRFRAKEEIAQMLAEIDPKPPVPTRIEPIAPAGPPGHRRGTIRDRMRSLAGPVRSLPAGARPGDWIEPPPPANAGAASEVADPEQTRELAEAEAALDDEAGRGVGACATDVERDGPSCRDIASARRASAAPCERRGPPWRLDG